MQMKNSFPLPSRLFSLEFTSSALLALFYMHKENALWQQDDWLFYTFRQVGRKYKAINCREFWQNLLPVLLLLSAHVKSASKPSVIQISTKYTVQTFWFDLCTIWTQGGEIENNMLTFASCLRIPPSGQLPLCRTNKSTKTFLTPLGGIRLILWSSKLQLAWDCRSFSSTHF